MSIEKYKILNPIQNNKKPFLTKDGFFVFKVEYNNIKYVLECSNINEHTKNKEYIILLGEYKFDEHCRKCYVDDYKRCKFKPKGELKDYIEKEIAERGNIEVLEIDNSGIYVTFKVV